MKDFMTIVQRMDNVDFSEVSTDVKREFIINESKKISLDELSLKVLLERNNC